MPDWQSSLQALGGRPWALGLAALALLQLALAVALRRSAAARVARLRAELEPALEALRQELRSQAEALRVLSQGPRQALSELREAIAAAAGGAAALMARLAEGRPSHTVDDVAAVGKQADRLEELLAARSADLGAEDRRLGQELVRALDGFVSSVHPSRANPGQARAQLQAVATLARQLEGRLRALLGADAGGAIGR
jgi:hypothetical protein